MLLNVTTADWFIDIALLLIALLQLREERLTTAHRPGVQV